MCNELCGVAVVDEERSEGESVLSNSHKANQSKPSLAEPSKNDSKFLRVYGEDQVRSVSGQMAWLNDEREPLLNGNVDQRFSSARISNMIRSKVSGKSIKENDEIVHEPDAGA